MVFNLNSQFSSWRHYQALDRTNLVLVFIIRVTWLFQVSNQDINHGNGESEGFALASSRCNNLINMGVKEHEGTRLNISRCNEVVGN